MRSPVSLVRPMTRLVTMSSETFKSRANSPLDSNFESISSPSNFPSSAQRHAMRILCGFYFARCKTFPQDLLYDARMNPASLPVEISNRKRGPSRFFVGKKLDELIVKLQEPGSTYAKVAAHFGCGVRTIELTVARLKEEAPDSGQPGQAPTAEAGSQDTARRDVAS